MPPRWDCLALINESEAVARQIQSSLSKNSHAMPAGNIYADKPRGGARPLNIMRLQDRVLYRALTDVLLEDLPDRFHSRPPFAEFARQPLSNEVNHYVSKSDINSYYVYVDHEILADELIAQTGNELAVRALTDLLGQVMGRRFGIPQVHPCSDRLGDVYIDVVRRRLIRRGYDVYTYSDDLRVGTKSLRAARHAVQDCAREASKLGLVLNERKTKTYLRDNYESSLENHIQAEQRILSGTGAVNLDVANAFLMQDDYSDVVDIGVLDAVLEQLGGLEGNDTGFDEEDQLRSQDSGSFNASGQFDSWEPANEEDARQGQIAAAVWDLWASQSGEPSRDAPILQDLLEKALPTLGRMGHPGPLDKLRTLLTSVPGLTPRISQYLVHYGLHAGLSRAQGRTARGSVRRALAEVIVDGPLSDWQELWLADTIGLIPRTRPNSPLVTWLFTCVESGSSAVVATAASALTRLGFGDAERFKVALDHVGMEWRQLLYFALAKSDAQLAEDLSDGRLDLLLLSALRDE